MKIWSQPFQPCQNLHYNHTKEKGLCFSVKKSITWRWRVRIMMLILLEDLESTHAENDQTPTSTILSCSHYHRELGTSGLTISLIKLSLLFNETLQTIFYSISMCHLSKQLKIGPILLWVLQPIEEEMACGILPFLHCLFIHQVFYPLGD